MTRPTILSLIELRTADLQDRLHQTYHVITDPARAAEVEVVLTAGNVGLRSDLMAALPRLRLIAVNGVGVDAIDLEQARQRGIAVTTVPGTLSHAVAESALALALDAGRKITAGDRFIRDGHWAAGRNIAPGRSVLTRRAGILGYGAIGRALAQMLRGLGMTVLYTARSQKTDTPDQFRPDLISLARDCDILFVTNSAGPETRGMVDAAILQALGPDGILVNVARGLIVDAQALAQALQTGTIAAAGLDVFENEPNVPQALLDAPNCVLNPHMAANTVETRQAMGDLALDNIDAWFAGKPLPTPLSF